MKKTIVKYQQIRANNNLLCLLIFCLFFSINEVTGQKNTTITNFQFSATFLQNELNFEKGQMISNVIKITNINHRPIRFYIDLSIPSNWKTLNKTDYIWQINPGDSLFIPVRIIPMGEIQGNTRYLFNAFIITEDGQQIGYTYFFASTKKNISWSLTASDDKIYFRNGETQCRFSYSLFNKGSEDQEILVTLNALSKNAKISDTLDNFSQNKFFTINLPSNKDTSFYLKYNIVKTERNQKMVDIEGYIPYLLGAEQKNTLFINSTTPNISEKHTFRASDKIDFIKLNDELKVNPYGRSIIPLVADLNAYNILGDYPMMNLSLRGSAFLNQNSSLSYSTQLTYSSNYYTNNPIKNAPLYLGYFHKKGSVQIGDISGGGFGIGGSGKGIRGDYIINKQNRISAFYSHGPQFFKNVNYYSLGVNHQFSSKRINLNTQYGHNTNKAFNRNIDAVNLKASFNIIKGHGFGIRLGGSRYFQKNLSLTSYGYSIGASYSGTYFKGRLATNLNGSYYKNGFGVSNSNRSVSLGNNIKINKKWSFSLNNSYSQTEVNDQLYNYKYDKQFNNQLGISGFNFKAGKFTPLLFYNISNTQNFRIHSRGLGVNFGKFDMAKNNRYFINLRGGYNNSPDILKTRDYFFFQFSSMVQRKTLSFVTRYSLGSMSLNKNNYAINNKKNPQFISLSLRHQYVFPIENFVIQNALSFSYSTISGKNITLNPDLYYFTRNGWRFRLYVDLNFSLSNQEIDVQYYAPINNDEPEPTPEWSKSFSMGVGIRKEFGIPIPRTKELFATIEYVAFLDINGNLIKDNNEQVLDNVVIRLDNWEVVTNDLGTATMENINVGTYPFNAFSLVDLKGWFPKLEDTLIITKSGTQYIPFTRGVKVSGIVTLQKDKMGAYADKAMDLSRIKITAVNGMYHTTLTNYDGSYSLYIPYGTYILTLDEKILGERYQLLQNNIQLDLSESYDNIFIPFYIVEKKKRVRMTKFTNNGLKISSNEAGENGSSNGNSNGNGKTNGNVDTNGKTNGSANVNPNKNSTNSPEITTPNSKNDTKNTKVKDKKKPKNKKNNKIQKEEIDTTGAINYGDHILDSTPDKKKDKKKDKEQAQTEQQQQLQPQLEQQTEQKQQPETEQQQQPERQPEAPTRIKRKDVGSSDIPIAEITDKGIIFTVCVFEKSANRKNVADFLFYSSLESVKCINASDDNYLYCSGSFVKYKKAQKYLDKVKSMGYSEATIIAFKDGVIMSIEGMNLE